MSGALKREFFQGGADGSVSVLGDANAACYFDLVKGAAGGRMTFTKPHVFAPNGTHLKNHSLIG